MPDVATEDGRSNEYNEMEKLCKSLEGISESLGDSIDLMVEYKDALCSEDESKLSLTSQNGETHDENGETPQKFVSFDADVHYYPNATCENPDEITMRKQEPADEEKVFVEPQLDVAVQPTPCKVPKLFTSSTSSVSSYVPLPGVPVTDLDTYDEVYKAHSRKMKDVEISGERSSLYTEDLVETS